MEIIEYFLRIIPRIMDGVFEASVVIRFRVTTPTNSFKFHMKGLDLKSVEIDG